MKALVTSRVFVIAFLAFSVLLLSRDCHSGVVPQLKKLRVPFVANEGQAAEGVRFHASTFGGAVFITDKGEVVYALAGGPAIEETFQGLSGKIRGEGKSITKVSYFRGNDPSLWKAGLPAYEAVSLGEACGGVGIVLRAYGGTVEKLFYVKPGARPEEIRVRLSGADRLSVNSDGGLEVKTQRGMVTFSKPLAYQEQGGKREPVEVSYAIEGREYGFRLGKYDKGKALVIDPLLSSTFLGGGITDVANAVVIGPTGDVYVAGETVSTTSFPVTPGAYDEVPEGAKDAFISRFSGDLSTLLSSTFLGGGSDDTAYNMAVDPAGDVYVTGETKSINFPTTPGAFGTVQNGNSDAFVSKLSGDLTGLLASTLLGGGLNDIARAVAVHSGNVYVAGETASAAGFPVTSGAYDETPNGAPDAFVSKLSGDLTGLLASTFLGGGTVDRANHMAVDPGGNVYVAGETSSTDFPTTPGAYDGSHNGASDAFVSRLDGDLTALVASTFLGGGSNDMAHQIAISGVDLYVAGETASTGNFPTTPGAFDRTHGGDVDAFVSRLDGDLTTLVASTFLGGGLSDIAYSMGVDAAGIVYLAGETASSGVTGEAFPTTAGAFDGTPNGNTDAFVSALSGNLSALLSSTFLGGGDNDAAYDMAVDSGGNVYAAGETTSTGGVSAVFPTTPGAYETVHSGDSDAFVSLLSDIGVSPFSLDFGSVEAGGASTPRAVTLSNTRTASTAVSSIVLSDNINYSLDVNGGSNPCGSASPTIGAGQGCTVAITFNPLSSGTFGAFLRVNSLGRVALDGRGGKDRKRCFIATAAYGSPMESHVLALRAFRDEHLLTNPLGRAFVDFYYRTSPPVARYIGKHRTLMALTRLVLAPVVFGVEHPMAALLIVTSVLVAAGARRRRRIVNQPGRRAGR